MGKGKNNELSKNIIVLAITLVLILAVLEGAARIFYPLYANYNTEMWRYSSEIKKISEYQGLSHDHLPNAHARLYGADVSTNSAGFRDDEHRFEKPNQTYRVLVLGDSIAFGWGVNISDTFPALLEKKLNSQRPGKYKKYEVINTGVGNYNTAMELITLKEKGLKFHPDLIIVEYYINDAEISPEKPKLALLKYSFLYAFFWDKYENVKVKLVEGNDYETYYKNLYKDGFPGKLATETALNEIITIARARNITVLIIILPEFHNFNDYKFSEVTSFVQQIAQRNNVTAVDFLPYFADYVPETIWVSYEDVHPNALGNSIIADGIYKEIVAREIIG